MASPFAVVLSRAQEAVLVSRARSGRAPHREVLRARIVLSAARGDPNAAIAADLRIHVDTVRKWRKRFAAEGLKGLEDLPRPGRPRTFTALQVAGNKALACTPPPQEAGLSRWSGSELAREAVRLGLVGSVSPATVARWLEQDAIKPWRYE